MINTVQCVAVQQITNPMPSTIQYTVRVRHNSAACALLSGRKPWRIKGNPYTHTVVKNALPHPEVKTAVTEHASLNSFIIAVFLHLNLEHNFLWKALVFHRFLVFRRQYRWVHYPRSVLKCRITDAVIVLSADNRCSFCKRNHEQNFPKHQKLKKLACTNDSSVSRGTDKDSERKQGYWNPRRRSEIPGPF